MKMEFQARFELLFDPKWPLRLLFIWTTMQKPRANWIILNQLRYFMTSLELFFVETYDLNMTEKFSRGRLQMTPYDLIW